MGLYNDPAEAAAPYLQQAAQTEQNYLSPFVTHGTQAGNTLSTQYGDLTSDPAAVLSKMMSSYEPSQFYDIMNKALSTSASNAAAAGGYRGAPYEQGKQQVITEGLLSKDMQQYLNNIFNLYFKGLGGEQGLYNTGFNAASSLAGDESNILGSAAQLAFQDAREEDARNQGIFGSLLGAATDVFGDFFNHGGK